MKLLKTSVIAIVIALALAAGVAAQNPTVVLQNAATANGNGTVWNATGFSVAIITVECTTCGGGTTITFEGTPALTKPYVGILSNQVGSTFWLAYATVPSGTVTTHWQVPLTGMRFIRARVSNYSAGTVTATAYGSIVPPQLTNMAVTLGAPVSLNPEVYDSLPTSGGTALLVAGWDGTNGRHIRTTTGGVLKIDGSAVVQPVSATALPLPSGAAADATLTGGTQRTKLTDGSSNVAVSTGLPSGSEVGLATRAVPLYRTTGFVTYPTVTPALDVTGAKWLVADVNTTGLLIASSCSITFTGSGGGPSQSGFMTWIRNAVYAGALGGRPDRMTFDGTFYYHPMVMMSVPPGYTTATWGCGGYTSGTAAMSLTATDVKPGSDTVEAYTVANGISPNYFQGLGIYDADVNAMTLLKGQGQSLNARLTNITTRQAGSASNFANDAATVVTIRDAASLPLPTGASTSALQTTGNTSLSSIDGKTPALGQAAMAASQPVVIASNQSAVPISNSSLTTIADATAVFGGGIPTNVMGAGVFDVETSSMSIARVTNTTPVGSEKGVVVRNVPSGTQTITGSVNQGSANTAANRWPVSVSDGTNSMPTMDAVARAGFHKITDGTNTATVKPATANAASSDPALVVAVRFPSYTVGAVTPPFPIQITGGGSYDPVAVKGSSVAAGATDNSLVVGLSPNSPLPAGTNAIGKLGANSGVIVGDVNIVSSIPGAGATNLGKAEDAAHTSGDVGVMAMGIRKDTNALTTSTDGDYTPASFDAYGVQFTRVDHPNRVRCTVTTSTATVITAVGGSCAAPGAGLSLYITDIEFSASASGIAADAFPTLKYGTGGTCGTGTTVFWGALTAAAIRAEKSFATPVKIPANNEVCWITSTAGSKFIVITGYIAQ